MLRYVTIITQECVQPTHYKQLEIITRELLALKIKTQL